MSSREVQAEQAAREDGVRLAGAVQALRARGFRGRTVLVDGTQYSPSWRALGGGGAAWELSSEAAEAATEGPGSSAGADVCEAYSEQLDRETDALGAYWDDGCLWWASEDFDHEASEEAGEDRFHEPTHEAPVDADVRGAFPGTGVRPGAPSCFDNGRCVGHERYPGAGTFGLTYCDRGEATS